MAESLIGRSNLTVSRIEPDAQLLLHCDPSDSASLASQVGLVLDKGMLRSERSGLWNALHLAPDEWLLIGPTGAEAELTKKLGNVSIPQSLVDVGERTLSLEIAGAAAERVINGGCPLDLQISEFPPGACTRTLFGKVMILLWRLSDRDCFRMQYGRSYDDYIRALLALASEDLPGSSEIR